jgi:hypothetical protein
MEPLVPWFFISMLEALMSIDPNPAVFVTY